jgi:hypothetical protein
LPVTAPAPGLAVVGTRAATLTGAASAAAVPAPADDAPGHLRPGDQGGVASSRRMPALPARKAIKPGRSPPPVTHNQGRLLVCVFHAGTRLQPPHQLLRTWQSKDRLQHRQAVLPGSPPTPTSSRPKGPP